MHRPGILNSHLTSQSVDYAGPGTAMHRLRLQHDEQRVPSTICTDGIADKSELLFLQAATMSYPLLWSAFVSCSTELSIWGADSGRVNYLLYVNSHRRMLLPIRKTSEAMKASAPCEGYS